MDPTPDRPEERAQASLQRAELMLLAAAASLAVIALILWVSPLAARLPTAWALMHPLSAAGMLLAAATLWIASLHGPSWQRYAALGGAGMLLILGLMGFVGSLSSAWMSAQTGLGFVLLGLLLPVSRAYRGPARMAADVLVLGFAIFVLVMLMGGLFAFSSAFGEVAAIRIPLLTLACFLLFAAVMVMHRSGGGILAVLRGDRIGSRIVRIAIPLALGLPLLLTLVRAYVVSTGLLAPAYASAASISFICLCVTLLALLMGWRINGLEREVRALLQRQADAKLQESEQRYMDLVEQSISGFVVRRADGRLILVNEAYRRMTGYSREELLQLSAKDLVVDQGVLERVRRLQEGESTHIETFLKRKDGTLLEVEYVTQRTRDGNLQTVLLDISHRKQLQKQRDESERRYGELVEQALEGISVRRPGGDYVFVNETFCKMLGYSREDLQRMSVADVVHADDADIIGRIQQLGHGGHAHLQARMRRRDGAVIHVEISARRLRNGDIQSTIQDVTERHAAEERERAYMEELREMSRRLSEAQETERRAIARELHDEVGQALTATRINLKDLQEHAGDATLAGRLADSEAVVAELLTKVRQMSLDLHPSVLDDLGLVPALRWCVRTRTVGSELQVLLHLPGELPRFEDMTEITLFRVFQETLSNVLKHAAAAHLDVHMEYAGGRLVMEVKDDGKGFDTEAARRDALSGKSLGLLGMQERARLAGGELILDSAPGKGTATRLSLPAQAR